VYRNLIVAITLFLSGHVSAHEWTPTYPELTPSHVEGVVYTDMLLLNRRQDIRYYEISVWDEEWNRVPFASEIRLVPLDYLDRRTIRIYIQEKDVGVARYICSLSKLVSDSQMTAASVSSRICSKLK